MELIERDEFLDFLRIQFKKIGGGEGYCIFVSGEAGIGKTSLVKSFCKEQKGNCNIYQGACDALFTPRPLAPLHDIIWQVNKELWHNSNTIQERSELFAAFFHELNIQKEKSLIVFEDIHWADEATLDFIKFFVRRIEQLRCLFILTFRDEDVSSRHPLRNVLGQLPPDSFTRLHLTPLSRHAVEKMSVEKGYSGEDVYTISGGNPFYVNEILSSYNLGIPENIKDSIISAYNRQTEKSKELWELISVVPGDFELKYLEQLEPLYLSILNHNIEARIIIIDNGKIYFKHELFRRTVEAFLSPLKRIYLNKRILDLLLEKFDQSRDIERIIHHAKNANEYDTVVHYTPIAAFHAAGIGAHVEASKLYFTAIEYYQGSDKNTLINFYELYSYECYLTNQIKQAIIYTSKSLELLKEINDIEKTGNSLRFLSRLWWLDGDKTKAEKFSDLAIDVLSNQPSSPVKAMAFSNMSQLKLLSDQPAECIFWGEKAIAMAKEVSDEESLAHAMNNIGSLQMIIQSSEEEGIGLLQQSLKIALKNSYHEHAARAYSNLGSIAVKKKNYSFAEKILYEGIQFCEERDLDSWRSNMLSLKARLNLETGKWKEAYNIADNLLKNKNQPIVATIVALIVVATIKMRRGDADALSLLLEAKTKSFENLELQRIIPALVTLLEYEWLTGKKVIKLKDIHLILERINQSINNVEKNEFAHWLLKARKQHLPLENVYKRYEVGTVSEALKAAGLWAKLGCPYEEALALFEGNDNSKRKAITIIHELGAKAVYDKMKLEMRASGIKNIPRGIRKSTQLNPAFLTARELDVLQLLKDGLQNKEIGNKLYISPKTVDHHISSIFFKLDVKTRMKAVAEATRQKILE